MINDYKTKFLDAQAQSDRNFVRYQRRKAQSDRNFARYEREKKRAIENEGIIDRLKTQVIDLQAEIERLKNNSISDFSSDFYCPNDDSRTTLSILGLKPGFTDKELKESYTRLVNRYHPDKHIHMSSGFIAEAETEFKKIKSAYEKIK